MQSCDWHKPNWAMQVRQLKTSLKSKERRLAPPVVAVLVSVLSAPASAQVPEPPAIAFTNASVVPLDHEGVKRGQTVLVRGDRIAAIGSTSEVSLPPGATIIDCTGQYLVPGLTDAHVHVAGSPLVPTRDDFGDAPIYLTYGITTVVNLSGTPTVLEWRNKVNAGTLLGPAIYTSGPFVNEPRVNTPDEVERDIVAQARLGYDLIKFHELFFTTKGLSLPAYRRMVETTRRIGIPLIGHAPVNLGIDEMLLQRQSIAHVGVLDNIYFLPFSSHTGMLLATAASTLTLICLAIGSLIAAVIRRSGQRRRSATEMTTRLTGVIALATAAAFVCVFAYLPGGPLFDSTLLRATFTVLACIVTGATLMIGFAAVRLFRSIDVPAVGKLQTLLAALSAVALSAALWSFWVPISWRSSDSGIERLAKRAHDAGIFAQSTLIVYETATTNGRTSLINDPAVELLMPSTREAWQEEPRRGIPLNRLTAFNQKVAGALHRNGVPIMAGTDALGLPLVAPGNSLHRELQLLTASGFSPYEAIRSATVVPAAFLGKANELGTIAIGRRADLLLVTGNPLENIAVLKRPNAVMVRGKWLPRQKLDEQVSRLARNE